MKLAIIASHPIQYQAPIFRELASRPNVQLHVHFGDLRDSASQGEGYGIEFEWDVPLLDGYEYSVFAPGVTSARDLAGMTAAWRRLGDELRIFGTNVAMHSGWHHPCMFPALAAVRGCGIPCMLRCEATAMTARTPVRRMWHRLILKQYAAFLPVGRENSTYYEMFGSHTTPRFLSPLFAGDEVMRRRTEEARYDRMSIRQEFGLNEEDFCFLFAGKFARVKRVKDLLKAASLVSNAGTRIQLLLVGCGEQDRDLKHVADESGVDVSFAGFVNQSRMPEAYAAADCLVLPSDSETWGLVVNEAMTCGLPAIVSDAVGCAADLVENGITGFVYPRGDISALAESLRQMAASPERARQMGAEAQKRIGSYSAAVAADGILAGARALAKKEMS